MNKFRMMLIVWQVVNTITNEILIALIDGVLDGPEFLKIVKSGLMSLRLSNLQSTDLDRLQLITTASEFQSLGFQDGDGAIYVPKDVLEKLKIDFN